MASLLVLEILSSPDSRRRGIKVVRRPKHQHTIEIDPARFRQVSQCLHRAGVLPSGRVVLSLAIGPVFDPVMSPLVE